MNPTFVSTAPRGHSSCSRIARFGTAHFVVVGRGRAPVSLLLSTAGARLPTLGAKRPWSCDTFVALPDVTADGSMLLAKNSDRPAKECQPLRYWPRRQSMATSPLRLAYVEIPDVRQSWAHLGGSPYWCWGHEPDSMSGVSASATKHCSPATSPSTSPNPVTASHRRQGYSGWN